MLEDVGEYKQKIAFIPQMHGGVMFIKMDELTHTVYELALSIAKNYSNYKFKYFEKPADEPILALSMAIVGCRPIEKEVNNAFLFYPVAKKVKQNMRRGYLAYTRDESGWLEGVKLMHWQNVFTNKPAYKIAVDALSLNKNTIHNMCVRLKWPLYYLNEWNDQTVIRVVRGIKRRVRKGK